MKEGRNPKRREVGTRASPGREGATLGRGTGSEGGRQRGVIRVIGPITDGSGPNRQATHPCAGRPQVKRVPAGWVVQDARTGRQGGGLGPGKCFELPASLLLPSLGPGHETSTSPPLRRLRRSGRPGEAAAAATDGSILG